MTLMVTAPSLSPLLALKAIQRQLEIWASFVSSQSPYRCATATLSGSPGGRMSLMICLNCGRLTTADTAR